MLKYKENKETVNNAKIEDEEHNLSTENPKLSDEKLLIAILRRRKHFLEDSEQNKIPLETIILLNLIFLILMSLLSPIFSKHLNNFGSVGFVSIIIFLNLFSLLTNKFIHKKTLLAYKKSISTLLTQANLDSNYQIPQALLVKNYLTHTTKLSSTSVERIVSNFNDKISLSDIIESSCVAFQEKLNNEIEKEEIYLELMSD